MPIDKPKIRAIEELQAQQAQQQGIWKGHLVIDVICQFFTRVSGEIVSEYNAKISRRSLQEAIENDPLIRFLYNIETSLGKIF